MKPSLSIIIPCYNCEKTLREAVDSCYAQGLDSFEIVMVNDGSTDGTEALIAEIATERGNVRIFSQPKNMGGGAARNRAVEESRGDVIFCLDSDDILAQGTLKKMVDFQREKGCDGVGISTSKKFAGKDVETIVRTDNFSYVGNKIPFESLFQKSGLKCPLYSTFLFTKKAFEISGGYPTAHGFDTQGFAWRFLGNGLTAYTCPNTIYLHRVHFHESYYLREYNSGRVNTNWQEVLEEFLFLLSPEAQEILLNSHKLTHDQNLMEAICSTKEPMAGRCVDFLMPHSREAYARALENTPVPLSANDLYWLGCFYMGTRKHDKAEKCFRSISNKDSAARKAQVKIKILEASSKGLSARKMQKMTDRLQGITSRRSLKGITRRLIHRIKIKARIFGSAMKVRSYKPGLIFGFIWLKTKAALKVHFKAERPAQADIRSIEVVIPTTTKDLSLLKSVLDSLSFLQAKIKKIHIIGPDMVALKEFCSKNKYNFISEESILPGVKNSIHYVIDDMDLSGWILQQLLKLKAADIIENEHYFVIDSDTILIRNHSFIENGKFVFLESAEWHEPYFEAFKRIFKTEAKNKTSSICHMMMFHTKRVLEMREEVEKIHGKPWEQAILGSLDYSKASCFSEFETYSNWMALRHPEEFIRRPFYNKSLPRSEFELTKGSLSERYRNVKSISFHSYEVPKATKNQ